MELGNPSSQKSASMISEHEQNEPTSLKRFRRSVVLRFLIALPVLMMCFIFQYSPNYQWVAERPVPFGGDFLQDWVGGRIIGSADSVRLYDIEYFKEVQHNSELVGFQWPESSYYPPIYPPFHYLAMRPLALLDYRTAAVVWGFISACALCLTFELLVRFYKPSRPFITPAIGLAMLFSPTLLCLNIGHKSTLLLLILTATFLLLHHRKPLLSGAVFGLIAFKPHLALIIGLAMLWKRQWKFLAGFGATLGVLVGWVMFQCPELGLGYLEVVRGTGEYVTTGGYVLADAHSLWGTVQLMCEGGGESAVNAITLLASLVVLGGMVTVLRGPMELGSQKFGLQFAVLVVGTILLSPHLYFYDLTMLLLPFVLAYANRYSLPSRGQFNSRTMVGLIVVMLFGAGTFKEVAQATRVQPSVILMSIFILGLAACSWNQFKSSPEPKRKRTTISDAIFPTRDLA